MNNMIEAITSVTIPQAVAIILVKLASYTILISMHIYMCTCVILFFVDVSQRQL